MPPALRTQLRETSNRNQSLQDILKTCKESVRVVRVMENPDLLHNTALVTILKNGKKRIHQYNRLDLAVILNGISIQAREINAVIHELNTKRSCDFTEDDVEIVGSHLVAKVDSLGYIGKHPLDGVSTGGGSPGSNTEMCAIATGTVGISPDLYYGHVLNNGTSDTPPVFIDEVSWQVEINGILHPTIIQASPESEENNVYFEEWVKERYPRHFDSIYVGSEDEGNTLGTSYLKIIKKTPGCASFKLIPSENPLPLFEKHLLGGITDPFNNPSFNIDSNGIITFSLVGPGEPDENSDDLDYVPEEPTPELPPITLDQSMLPFPQTISEWNTLSAYFGFDSRIINPFTDTRVRNVGAQTSQQRWTYSNMQQGEKFISGVSFDKAWVENAIANYPSHYSLGEMDVTNHSATLTVENLSGLISANQLVLVGDRYYFHLVNTIEGPQVAVSTATYYPDPEESVYGTVYQRIAVSFAIVVPEQGDPGYEGEINPDDNTPVQLENFDFAIIRYIWTAGGGTDLDTRTYLMNPSRKEQTVGWSRAQSDGSYLRWGGDNTGSGVEAILLDVARLAADFPAIDTFKISLNAYWFSSVLSGNLNVQFEMYKGGTMSQSGYDWINSGGQRTQTLTVACNTMQKQSDDIDGTPLVTLEYNPLTMVGNLIKL